MEFRQRGKSVQLIRIGAEDETGEAKPKVIGSVKAPNFIVDEELKTKLTPPELEDLAAYASRHQKLERISREHAAIHFADTLRHVHDWLKTASKAETASFLDETREPLTRLRRAIAKVGANDLSD